MEDNRTPTYIGAGAGILLTVILIIFFAIFQASRRHKDQKNQRDKQKWMESARLAKLREAKTIELEAEDEWELDRESLIIGAVVGEGTMFYYV